MKVGLFLNSSIMVDRDKLNVKYGRTDFDSMGYLLARC